LSAYRSESALRAKVNKLEKLQNDLAQIATYGIYAQRDMGHLDIDDNFL
jgi:hypothetical protein